MRLTRVSISVIALALGSLIIDATAAGAVSPCAPGRPPGRLPGQTGQPAGRPPQYPIGRCQAAISASSARVGAKITASGDGFQAGSTPVMRLGADTVGSAVADGQGRFTSELTVPAGTAPGQYDVFITGVGTDGTPYELTTTLEVLPPAAAGSAVSAGSGPILRPGAGLAASPQVGGLGQVAIPVGGGILATGGGNGSPAGVPLIGGATEQPSTGATGIAGASGAVVPQLAVAGAVVTGPTSSAGLSPMTELGGGLVLIGAGAGAALAARRRKPSQP